MWADYRSEGDFNNILNKNYVFYSICLNRKIKVLSLSCLTQVSFQHTDGRRNAAAQW